MIGVDDVRAGLLERERACAVVGEHADESSGRLVLREELCRRAGFEGEAVDLALEQAVRTAVGSYADVAAAATSAAVDGLLVGSVAASTAGARGREPAPSPEPVTVLGEGEVRELLSRVQQLAAALRGEGEDALRLAAGLTPEGYATLVESVGQMLSPRFAGLAGGGRAARRLMADALVVGALFGREAAKAGAS